MRPILEELLDPDGTEYVVVRKGMKPMRTLLSKIIGNLVKITRVEFYDVTTAANGTKAVVFGTPFAAPPKVEGLVTWSGMQMLSASISNITTTGCTVTAMRSKGTLLLSAGPFEQGGAHTVSIKVSGN